MDLNWGKCQGDVWCSFRNLKLESPIFNNAEGVYIIWSNNLTVKVGSGNLRNEINNDRVNIPYTAYNDLRVAWSIISDKDKIEGIRLFLIERLNPKIDSGVENILTTKIPVNTPWI